MNRAVVIAVSLSALLAPVRAQADSINVNVLSATYSANLNLTLQPDYGGGTTTATGTGSSPVSESLDLLQPYTLIDPNDGSVIYSTQLEMQASANADWLAVDVNLLQQGNYWSGQATADFDMTFSPVADGTATLGVDFTRSGEYGSGFGSLFDVTTQQELWRFSFGSDFGGCDFCPVAVNEGGIESFPGWSGPFALPSVLNAADVYDLHLTASTFNPAFRTFSSVQVSGLAPAPEPRVSGLVPLAEPQVSGLVAVPEPSSLLLLGIGFATLRTVRGASATKRHKGAQQ